MCSFIPFLFLQIAGRNWSWSSREAASAPANSTFRPFACAGFPAPAGIYTLLCQTLHLLWMNCADCVDMLLYFHLNSIFMVFRLQLRMQAKQFRCSFMADIIRAPLRVRLLGEAIVPRDRYQPDRKMWSALKFASTSRNKWLILFHPFQFNGIKTCHLVLQCIPTQKLETVSKVAFSLCLPRAMSIHMRRLMSYEFFRIEFYSDI